MANNTVDTRSIATRNKLIASGERLFAKYGIESVSLIEIARVANQRNRNALQYHFGNKRGLLQAILDKHMSHVTQERHHFLDQLDAEHKIEKLRELVEALVRPVALKLEDPDGGAFYISIQAQLAAQSTLAHYHIYHFELRMDQNDRLSSLFAACLSDIPKPVLQQRMMLATSTMFHALNDFVQMQRIADTSNLVVSRSFMIENLIDSLTGFLNSPISAKTTTLLESSDLSD